jgi:hypothetical protein
MSFCGVGHCGTDSGDLLDEGSDQESEQVPNWLNGSRSPSLDSYFKIQAFLKKQKNRRKSTR